MREGYWTKLAHPRVVVLERPQQVSSGRRSSAPTRRRLMCCASTRGGSLPRSPGPSLGMRNSAITVGRGRSPPRSPTPTGSRTGLTESSTHRFRCRPAHTGVLPKGAGYHHHPRPIVDIELFKYDDLILFVLNLFVTDSSGNQLAVTPTGRRGSGNGRVAVAWAPEGHPAHGKHPSTRTSGHQAILPADSDVAKRTFVNRS